MTPVKKRLLALLVASLVLLVTIDAKAQPVVDIRYQYYSVSGNTVEQIAQSLYEQTPIVYQGKKFHAYTRWTVQWRFRSQQSSQGCTISSRTTQVNVRYTLPRLVNENRLATAVRNRWRNYYQALVRHEDGHRDFGLMAAREIQRRLPTIGLRSSCQQLEQDANQFANRIIAKYAAQEREYDRITNHGARDGAIFP